jgi:hypothetical protein
MGLFQHVTVHGGREPRAKNLRRRVGALEERMPESFIERDRMGFYGYLKSFSSGVDLVWQ